MTRAYLLAEGQNLVPDKLRISLANAKQIVHGVYPGEVVVHVEATSASDVNRAIADLGAVEGVGRLTLLALLRE